MRWSSGFRLDFLAFFVCFLISSLLLHCFRSVRCVSLRRLVDSGGGGGGGEGGGRGFCNFAPGFFCNVLYLIIGGGGGGGGGVEGGGRMAIGKEMDVT